MQLHERTHKPAGGAAASMLCKTLLKVVLELVPTMSLYIAPGGGLGDAPGGAQTNVNTMLA